MDFENLLQDEEEGEEGEEELTILDSDHVCRSFFFFNIHMICPSGRDKCHCILCIAVFVCADSSQLKAWSCSFQLSHGFISFKSRMSVSHKAYSRPVRWLVTDAMFDLSAAPGQEASSGSDRPAAQETA